MTTRASPEQGREEIREQIVALCLDLSRRGLLSGTGGNVALRTDAQHFAVTPSGIDYHRMTAADVCVLRLSDLQRVAGDRAPSVESSLHARVLRARPDCGCSIHTHQPVASACALLDEPLAVDDAALRRLLGARVPVVGYAPSGTGWLAHKLQSALQPGVNAYLMRNHGVLCCGADIEQAMRAVQALEDFCAQHLRSRIAVNAALRPTQRGAFQRVLAALARSSDEQP
jgi:L-fuculose-phosphate aldolase